MRPCRGLILLDFLSTTEILGFPSLPEGVEAGGRGQYAYAVHQELHAVMDQSFVK